MASMDKRKWLYLPIETKVRELDAKLLLTYYAVQANYKVVLGLSGMIEQSLEYLPNGIFLDKGYLWKDKVRRFGLAKKSGHIVVNLEEEGFPLTEKEIYLDKHLSQESLNHLDYEYCWGPYQRDTIVAAYPSAKKKCMITGNTRFDLLDKKYRSLFNSSTKQIREKYGDFILVNTKFPLYTKTVNEDGEHNNSLVKRLKNKYGSYRYENMKSKYKKFIHMVRALSIEFPQMNLVIRPHPSDKFEVFARDLVDCENVYVVHEGNVVNWINASQLVIHNGCTTGVEAFLLEKPVISFITSDENTFDLPNEMSIKMEEVEDICMFIRSDMKSYNFSENKFKEKQKADLLQKYYSHNPNKLSYQNIIRKLNALKTNRLSPKHIKISSKHMRVLNKESTSKNRLYRKNKIVKQKFPDLTEKEIENFFKKLNLIEGKKVRINVRKLHDKLFEITRY
ncbi:surface carbohydrate biosynthesis protein [Halobacillus sp. Nhm2S1]|uniref:surface carbohydrate biosynthesis protein n=1 Tax=Halobacillus sp. Nhm2S1 TaxID=2866716 RepID=UPI001C73DE24|nr:surface carbohydrate biosynthesis protein [Halobacillus sp. Nhm2S1]MBX0359455.1 hypothetical protein [Halobacillus sp. Nhm2S1]